MSLVFDVPCICILTSDIQHMKSNNSCNNLSIVECEIFYSALFRSVYFLKAYTFSHDLLWLKITQSSIFSANMDTVPTVTPRKNPIKSLDQNRCTVCHTNSTYPWTVWDIVDENYENSPQSNDFSIWFISTDPYNTHINLDDKMQYPYRDVYCRSGAGA